MAAEEGKSRGVAMPATGDHHQPLPQQYYGTFSGAPSYSQPPAMGFPQPIAPPGSAPSAPPYPQPHHQYPAPGYYAHGYQVIPGYAAVAEGTPVRMPRLPCCGIGIGWLMFVTGFFLPAIPWYVGAFVLLCVRIDYREKPGFIACTIAAVLTGVAVLLGLTNGLDDW